MKKILATTAVLVLLAVCPSHAGAPTVVKTTSQGVFAQFVSSSPDGCFLTAAIVFANADADRLTTPGAPTNSGIVSVAVTVYDTCHDVIEVVGEGFASLDSPDTNETGALHISSDLSSCTLTGTVPIQNQNDGTVFSVGVNLTWTASGHMTAQTFNYNDTNTPGIRIVTAFEESTRPAVASGTVTVVSGDPRSTYVNPGFNFAPLPATGQIESVVNTTTTVPTP